MKSIQSKDVVVEDLNSPRDLTEVTKSRILIFESDNALTSSFNETISLVVRWGLDSNIVVSDNLVEKRGLL